VGKSVCLVTSEESFCTNYGAPLQGYALYRTLSSLGYETNILRYKSGPAHTRDSLLNRVRRVVMGNDLRAIVQKVKFRANQKLMTEDHKKRYQLFLSFQHEHMTFCNSKRLTWEELRAKPIAADIYVCGSDQIWNPLFRGNTNDRGYFLAFAPEHAKLVAYAPSLGVPSISEELKKDMGELLKRFDHISVRESTGAAIVSEILGYDVPNVLDPAFLLTENDWKQIAKPHQTPERYALAYLFGYEYSHISIAKEIAQKLGLPVISLPMSAIAEAEKDFVKDYGVGPLEFIHLVENAELVITDSFHAVVFSLIMQTPFVVFPRPVVGGNDMNSRITDLLDMVNLTDRIVYQRGNIDYDSLLCVEWSCVSKVLAEKRQASKEWLIAALGNG
jgi:hypothetical protein